MAKKKDVFDYKTRQIVRRESIIDDDTSLGALLYICNNDESATIEFEHWYEDVTVKLVWKEPETDIEMNKRITKYEADRARLKEKEAKQKAAKDAAERKEYARLKKKFEKA